jgi:3-hydroxyisobutyrate dehydrogenase-like beta-hydroxyacid dehydrogenase
MQKVGLIGPGKMGRGIARNLMKAGYPLSVHKRSIREDDPVVQELRSQGAILSENLQDIYATVEVLMTCLPSSREVEEVLIRDESLLHAAETTVSVVLDFTTARPASTRHVYAELAKRNISVVDTPMTGGPEQAEEGALNLAVGGDRSVYIEMEPLLKCIAKNIVYCGPSGCGHTVKLLNNFLGMLNRCSASASCLIAERAGIGREDLLEFIRIGGGYSRGFESQLSMILEDDLSPRFTSALALKDMRYLQELFKEKRLIYPIIDDLVSLLAETSAGGFSDMDMGAVYLYLKERKS